METEKCRGIEPNYRFSSRILRRICLHIGCSLADAHLEVHIEFAFFADCNQACLHMRAMWLPAAIKLKKKKTRTKIKTIAVALMQN